MNQLWDAGNFDHISISDFKKIFSGAEKVLHIAFRKL